MRKISQMTDHQFKELLDEYFAPPEKRSRMTETEIRDLARKLNKKIDVPFITETGEEKILIKIVLKIDGFLYDNLPNELYDLIRSTERGISDDEAKHLTKRLAVLANKHIDIPYLWENMEYIAIKFVIGLIVNALRKGWDLEKAHENDDDMVIIGSNEEPDDNELNGIVIPDR